MRMLGEVNHQQKWQPWLRKTLSKRTDAPAYPKQKDMPGRKDGGLIVFARILYGESSEAHTLRDLANGVMVYEVKAKLELMSGIPAYVMEMFSQDDKPFDNEDALEEGKNIMFGKTVRIRLNSQWNPVLQAAWKGSLSELQKYVGLVYRKLHSSVGLPRAETQLTNEKVYENLLGEALFVASRRGSEGICKYLLKTGSSATTYATSLGNTCVHASAYGGHLQILQLVVSYGANVRFSNVFGQSPMELAIARGYVDCARWLWLNQWTLSITRDMIDRSEKSYSVPTSKDDTIARSKTRGSQPQHTELPPTKDRGRSARKPNGLLADVSPRPHTIATGRQKDRSFLVASPREFRASLAPDNPEKVKRPTTTRPEKTKEILTFFTSQRKRQRSIPSKYSSGNLIENLRGNSLNLHASQPIQEQEPQHDQLLTEDPPMPKQHETGNNSGSGEQLKADRPAPEGTTILPSPQPENESTPKQRQILSESSTDTSGDKPKISNPLKQSELTVLKVGEDYNAESPNHADEDVSSVTSSGEQGPFYHHVTDVQVHVVAQQDESVPEMSPIAETKNLAVDENSELEGIEDKGMDNDRKPAQGKSTDGILVEKGEEKSPESAKNDESLRYAEAEVDKVTTPREDNRHPNDQLKTTHADADKASLAVDEGVTLETLTIGRLSVSIGSPKEDTEDTPKWAQLDQEKFIFRNETSREIASDDKVHAKEPERDNEIADNRPKATPLSPVMRAEPAPSYSPRKSTTSQPNIVTKRISRQEDAGKVAAPKMEDPEKEEKNRKAFNEWLAKKRKSVSKNRDNETDNDFDTDRRKSQHRISTGISFEQWLETKREVATEGNIGTEDVPPESPRKSSRKFSKTFEEWMNEKEGEIKHTVEKQKALELEQKKKEEAEAEKRHIEYEKKMEEWKRKKEEMRKNEQERKKKIQQMSVETANLLYQEWLKKPRVKTFEEWAKRKEMDMKVHKISTAQKEVLQKHHTEVTAMRQQIAKEKFQQWVMKKDLGKLRSSQVELEVVRNMRARRQEKPFLSLLLEGEEEEGDGEWE